MSAARTPRHLLGPAIARLRAAGVDGAARDARWLMAHALGIAPDRLVLADDRVLDDKELARFDTAIAARAAFQPVAQIIGRRAFYGREFLVSQAVLDPRPETETLVEQALGVDFTRVLDLGVGSGAIVLSLLAERIEAHGLGLDLSQAALDVAARNAARLGVADRVDLRRSDWFSNVTGQFDLIVSNPPYIAARELESLSPELLNWEPRAALVPANDSGDGLAAYRIILAQAPRYLLPGGWLMVEIGATQADPVTELFRNAGFLAVELVHDLDGRARVLRGQMRAG